MFKKNTRHLQKSLFGLYNSLPASLQKDIRKSKEYHFYQLVFCHIPEEKFSKLYSDKKSRPNSGVNEMIASFILKEANGWTYEQLFDAIKFNILTKIALGLDQIDDIPFCPASIFNFQNRINKHFIETGENLLEQVFDHLTQKQLKALKIKTNIQRTDSFAAASNIRNYSRLQLLIEMIIRIYRVLSDEDKKNFQQKFQEYIKQTSGQYIYRLKSSDLPHELEKIGQLYYWIYDNLYSQYAEYNIFQAFERVYTEHFTIVKDKVTVKTAEELSSNCVQSPDDLDATYRNKNGKTSKGQSINIVETAHPDNEANLIVDVAVNPNNKDDGKVLDERLETIKEKTPDIEELHFDGAYGNLENDKNFEQMGITPVQTAVKGREAAVPIEIVQAKDNEYTVSCPHQTVISQPTPSRHKAEFDLSVCAQCSYFKQCPAKTMKNSKTFYFTHDDYLRKKRQRAIYHIPSERRKLRSNVEATVHEFTCKMPQKKLKVRGSFKASVFAFTMAIAINFGRIYRLVTTKPGDFSFIFSKLFDFVKERLTFFLFLFRCSVVKRYFMNFMAKPCPIRLKPVF